MIFLIYIYVCVCVCMCVCVCVFVGVYNYHYYIDGTYTFKSKVCQRECDGNRNTPYCNSWTFNNLTSYN